jgi:hypothetical protein
MDAVFDCYAAAETMGHLSLNAPPLVQASMIVIPVPAGAPHIGPPPFAVGPACRICPVGDCAGRREPSILSDGF